MKPIVAALNRKTSGLFLLSAVLAAAWIGLNLIAPDLAVGRVPVRLGFMLISVAVVLYGLLKGLGSAGFAETTRVPVWIAVATVLAIWIAAAWALAANGTFRRDIGRIPMLPLAIFLPAFLGLIFVTRSRTVASLLDATPASWLIGVQVYRILGGVFLVYWVHGSIPGAFALPAGIGDVATGLLALPAAVWVASGSQVGRRIGIRWNLFGLADFAVAITMGMLTSPGPAHLLARAHPNTLIATFPTAMIPAFAVPFSILLHALSLRQLERLQPIAVTGRGAPVLV